MSNVIVKIGPLRILLSKVVPAGRQQSDTCPPAIPVGGKSLPAIPSGGKSPPTVPSGGKSLGTKHQSASRHSDPTTSCHSIRRNVPRVAAEDFLPFQMAGGHVSLPFLPDRAIFDKFFSEEAIFSNCIGQEAIFVKKSARG